MSAAGFSREELAAVASRRPGALLGCGLLRCAPDCEMAVKGVLKALEEVLGSPEEVVQVRAMTLVG